MAVKLFNFKWVYNDSTVYVDLVVPRIFEKEVDLNQTIIIDLKDKNFNIDIDSIKLFLNGFDITSATTISSITDGYRIKYIPTIDFVYSSTIRILVRAANEKGVYMSDYSYYFITKRKRLVNLIENKVKKIVENINWDNVGE